MSKNSLGSNFTGSGSKRPKKYYKDTDAGKHFFKPDHSEYYPGSKKKEIDYPYSIDAEYDTNVSNAEADRPEIELHETKGATSIRAKTAKEIADELNPRKVINRGDSEKHKKHQRKELIDVMLMDDEYEDDLYRNIKTLANAHGTMSSGILHDAKSDSDNRSDPRFKYQKNAKARNTKTNSNYRPWQEEQRNGGQDQILFNDMEANPDNLDIDEPMSPTEVILENRPNFIWEDDQKQAA